MGGLSSFGAMSQELRPSGVDQASTMVPPQLVSINPKVYHQIHQVKKSINNVSNITTLSFPNLSAIFLMVSKQMAEKPWTLSDSEPLHHLR